MDEAPKPSPSRPGRRLIAGYGVAALLVVGLAVGAIVLIGGGDGEDGADTNVAAARINLQTGVTDGKEPDGREGTPLRAPSTQDLAGAAEKAGCELTEDLEDEGNTHIPPGTPAPTYITTPAASGDHYPDPQADGAYAEPISPLRYIHALEHGRVALAYSSELPEQAQLELKGLFDDDAGAILLFPYDEMPYAVAAVAWTRLLGCESYAGAATLSAVRSFRDRWRGRGPERLAY